MKEPEPVRNDQRHEDRARAAASRKPYAAPALVELGAFTHLTRGVPGPEIFEDPEFPFGGAVDHDDFS